MLVDGARDARDRRAMLRNVLDHVVQRWGAGELVDTGALCATHAELMPELRRQLDMLALLHRAAGEARRDSGRSAAAAPARESAPPPDLQGYEISREVHRGGQGVVYEAVQLSTRRRVAIKVMREGPFAHAADHARFDREVQILAQLNHPHIVAIHDRGRVAGHEFFVMDFVDGRPLDRWLSDGATNDGRSRGGVDWGGSVEAPQSRVAARMRRPGVLVALRVFIDVCNAVNAAHLRGVIHRDLKPSNILVDGGGAPRVLDFGLAKFADAAADESAAAMTTTGQFVGSLPWSSPEQAAGEAVDTRTDVYSLGVILYRCLTGRYPYPVIGRPAEVIHAIRTREPDRPQSPDGAVDDELETIVLKCLNKDRERRYQTAGELARDLDRYLAGEPIEAKRDSLAYLLRKRLRQYRLPVAAAAAFVVLLVAALTVSIVLWGRAAEQRDRAMAAEQTQIELRQQAEVVNEFLQYMLAGANRGEYGGREFTVRELLEQASRKIDEGGMADKPAVEAEVRTTIGETYVGLGLHAAAEHHFRRALELRREALGDGAPEVAISMNNLAAALSEQGRFAEAEPLMREALAVHRAVQGPENRDVADTLNNLAVVVWEQKRFTAAEPLIREALAMRRRFLGEDDPLVAASIHNLASILEDQNRLDEAAALYRDALARKRNALGDAHPSVAVSLHNLGELLWRSGDFATAESTLREALAMRRKLLGDEHPDVAATLQRLATLLREGGRLDEAEAMHREALEIRSTLVGDDHLDVAFAMNELAVVLRERENPQEAEPLLREALAITRRKLGDDHSAVGVRLHNLGATLADLGRFEEAESCLRDSLRIRTQRFGAGDARPLETMGALGDAIGRAGRFEEAEALLLDALTGLRAAVGDSHRSTLKCVRKTAELYEAWGKPEKAAEYRALLPP
jgi:tetratricopeptide (TPR) repeat protein